jgi:general stress protein CsbA
MTYHPTSAVSVAIVLTVVFVVVSYRAGRTHSAWHEVHHVKRSLMLHRRHAWTETFQFVVGAALVLALLAAAGYVAAT